MIIIIDNYDSFTYNLFQYAGKINPDIEVYRNDKTTIEEIRIKKPSHIIISPGPGYPSDAGISTNIVKELGKNIPVLGVCLGHQCIGEAFGGKITHAEKLMHGRASEIDIITGCAVFKGLQNRITAGRYHSLVVQKDTLPDSLEITAISIEGEIMGLQHKDYPVYGIQFHPESILTPCGRKILENFLTL